MNSQQLRQKTLKLVLSALMAALVYVATSIIQIPSPVNGYVNLGDCFVLLSGWLLGPWYGGAAAMATMSPAPSSSRAWTLWRQP